MKFRVDEKDLKIFICFSILLLYLCAVAVLNLHSLATSGTIYGFVPFEAFSKEFIARFSDIIEFNDITEDMIKMFLNKKHIKDQNILNEFDFHKNGFRGLDQFLEKEIKKHKNSKMQV